MKMQVLSVFDQASASFARPIFVASKGAAIRMFTDEVNRVSGDNVMNGHPEDFSLFHIGEFDDSTGLFVSLPVPDRVVTARECVTIK